MKKKTLATVISVIGVLLISTSISYAFTSDEWLALHNEYRCRHGVPILQWSDSRAAEAQDAANKCTSADPHCVKQRSGSWSENWSPYETPQGAVDDWYSEIASYDYNNPQNNGDTGKITGTGHFITLVDKNITEVGCASNSKGSWCVYTGQKSIYGVLKGAVEYESNKGHWVPKMKVCSVMGDDILWHHAWGYTGAWVMNGAKYDYKVDIGWPPIEWKVVGTADFNDDGQTDIVWRNAKTGELTLWKMDGSQIKSETSLRIWHSVAWNTVGTGDFNGDGHIDILMQHEDEKYVVIGLMDGVKHTKWVFLPYSKPPWKIAGVGDFNGDYHSDVLWRNTASGVNAVWYVHGAEYKEMDYIASAHPDWEIGATGDLNDDGKTDIVWRNTKTGANAVWYMDGATFKSYAWLPPVSDLNFEMVGAGNFE